MTRLRSIFALALSVAVAACGDRAPTDPAAPRRVPVAVRASLTAEQQRFIAGMSVEVTGPGIAVPVIAVLDVAGTTVNGTVTIPAGPDRIFTVHAFDAGGEETYVGSALATVTAGTNPPVLVTLQPREGGVPVVVTVGGVSLALNVASVRLDAGATATVTATVTDGGVPVTSGAVEWGVLNPALLGVTPALGGRTVTLAGQGAGTTVLVARFGAVAAAVPVTIDPGAPPEAPLLPRLVAVGPTSSCAIAARSNTAGASASVFCWGDNAVGQVGVEDAGPILTPRLVTTLVQQAELQLGVGFVHACARPWPGSETDPGSAACWGDPAAFGGTGSEPQRLVLPDGIQTVHLAVGARHTCLTGNDGRVHCAGDPADGRLGGVPTGGSPFVTVTSPEHHFVSAAAGFRHTCALTVLGAAWCWGDNSRGQLGDGGTTSSSTPVRAAAGLELAWIWAGDDVTCGFTTARELWCWGDNLSGQLGRDPFDTRDGAPMQYSATARLVRTATAASGKLVDMRVPQWLDASTGTVTWWYAMGGSMIETLRFGGLLDASGFTDRFCGIDAGTHVVRCTGALPGTGETFTSGFLPVNLEAALGGGGSTP